MNSRKRKSLEHELVVKLTRGSIISEVHANHLASLLFDGQILGMRGVGATDYSISFSLAAGDVMSFPNYARDHATHAHRLIIGAKNRTNIDWDQFSKALHQNMTRFSWFNTGLDQAIKHECQRMINEDFTI